MNQFAQHDIPEELREMADGDMTHFEKYEKYVAEAPSSPDAYFEAFTAIVHLEELADSTRLKKFNLYGVHIYATDDSECTYKIKFDVMIYC